ncbi:MAG: RNA polymerase sigma factor [Micrococcales bacterium]|nr:RNA polymerase sigma factor [Micrococcales bacterium]
MAVNIWTVTEFGAFYTEHRSELLAHANRTLKDSAKSEEIIQDALIKFMLATPELESSDHALSYLHRTIENLCIDHFRLEGRRPNLVVIDDAQAEVEAKWQVSGDHSEVLTQAEDAAIIRQALALLSPAERAALVMWEMEGRSTAEIAAELGIKDSAVRHTVSRARASLRRVLSELIIDQERGLTALDMLSTTYKKAAVLAKKSSKVALSLLIVMVAFLGFNSVTGSEFDTGAVISNLTQEAPSTSQPLTTIPTPDAEDDLLSRKLTENNSAINFRTSKSLFAGLSKDGLPTGFTVSDAAGNVGSLSISSQSTITNPDGYVLVSYAQSSGEVTLNALISQTITVDGAGTSYFASPSVTVAGSWFPLTQTGSASTISRLSNGNYLLTATIYIDSTVDSALFVAATGGLDVDAIPNEITTRIILNSSKSTILAQAINVGAKGVK